MKDIVNTSFRLALICAVAAVALAGINTITAPKIEEYNHQLLLDALSAVSSGFDISGESITNTDPGYPTVIEYYELHDNGELCGYILSLSASGYGGPMEMIAGYALDGTLLGSRLMSNAETPGLGKEAEKDSYMEMFKGTGGEEPVPQRKNQLPADRADSISGATITFTGVAKALASGSEFVKSFL